MHRYSGKILLLIFSIFLMGGGIDLNAQSKKKKGKDGRDKYVSGAKIAEEAISFARTRDI